MKRLLLLAYVLFFSCFVFSAHAKPWGNVPHTKTISIDTDDGATVMMTHLVQPDGPVLLLVPGLGASGGSLEGIAIAAYEKGYDVFIGNTRGAVRLPNGGDGLSRRGRNGLPEVCLYDFPAQMRSVLKHTTERQHDMKISVLGHSMGGIMAMTTPSNPGLRAEFLRYIKAIALLHSPHHLADIRPRGIVGMTAPLILSALKRLSNNGVPLIKIHSLLAEEEGTETGWLQDIILPGARRFNASMALAFLNPAHQGDKSDRNEILLSKAAWGVPVDLLTDIVTAALHGGRINDRAGKALVNPAEIATLPILLIGAELDSFATKTEQKQYRDKLGTPFKATLDFKGINHSDLTFIDDPSFFEKIFKFLGNPEVYTKAHPSDNVPLSCQRLLRRNRRLWRGA